MTAGTLNLKSFMTNAFGPQVLIEGCELMTLTQDGSQGPIPTPPR